MVATLDQASYQALYAKPRQRSTPKQDRRARWQVRFWLDLAKDTEYALAEQVQTLKASRMFTSTVREALELIFSLQKRETIILERLFPWIAEHYRTKYVVGQGDMAARLAALETQISQMQSAAQPPPTPGPKPLAKVAAPPAEDDDDAGLLTIKKAAPDGKAASNFLASAFALVD